MKIDIELGVGLLFFFRFKKKKKEMRLRIIREEIFNNIPKYNADPNDLIIKMRAGDIFLTNFSPNYAQPPLCFYQKIINENNFKKIYILSNGHENPVIDKLMKLYSKIRYIEGKLVEAISIIVNCYNLVLPVSTFPKIFN